jgi:hypothetical protein
MQNKIVALNSVQLTQLPTQRISPPQRTPNLLGKGGPFTPFNEYLLSVDQVCSR